MKLNYVWKINRPKTGHRLPSCERKRVDTGNSFAIVYQEVSIKFSQLVQQTVTP